MSSGEIVGVKEQAEKVRYIPRTAVVLNVIDTYNQTFIPLCAKRPKDTDTFSSEESLVARDAGSVLPRNWEWPGGKVDNGVEGSGHKRQFARLPFTILLQAALREVGEELQVTNGYMHYLERMP